MDGESENRVKASTRSVQSLGQLLLQGYCMLADGCAECMVRVFRIDVYRFNLMGMCCGCRSLSVVCSQLKCSTEESFAC